MIKNKRLVKIISVFILQIILSVSIVKGQVIFKSMDEHIADSINSVYVPVNKIIPAGVKREVITALSYYPELKDISIVFRLKRRFIPLVTRVRPLTVLRNKNKRVFVITISTSTLNKYEPILLHNMSFNSRVGVLGHELSHVADFSSRSFRNLAGVIPGQISKRYLDNMEFNTDKRCIEHGLGFQLLCWSKEVREKLKIIDPIGTNSAVALKKRERYMSPSTIQNYIEKLAIYK